MTPTKSAFPFLHGLALSEAGHTVQIFLLGEAVSLMRKSVAEAVVPVGWPALAETMHKITARQVVVYACGACCRARSVTESDLSQWGAKFGNPQIFVSLVEWGRSRHHRIALALDQFSLLDPTRLVLIGARRTLRHRRSHSSPGKVAGSRGRSCHTAVVEFADRATSARRDHRATELAAPKPCFSVITADGTWYSKNGVPAARLDRLHPRSHDPGRSAPRRAAGRRSRSSAPRPAHPRPARSSTCQTTPRLESRETPPAAPCAGAVPCSSSG